MSLVIYDFAQNGATPGAINPQLYDSNPAGSVESFYVIAQAKANLSRSILEEFKDTKRLALHIDWVQSVALGSFRVQLGMEGGNGFLTAFEFAAATDFNNSVDDAIGLVFNPGFYETIRFDGSSVTGGSPIVRLG